MQEKTLKQLLEKFEEMLISGKTVYFDVDEYDSIAEYYDQIDNLDKAKYILNLGQEVHPHSELLILRRARFMMYDNQYLDAIDYLDKHFNTYEFDLYLLKIECYLFLHLYAEAYVLAQQVLMDEDNDKDIVLSELGYVYLETEYLKDAQVYLEESLNYNSDNEEVLSELIFIYESENDYPKAIEYCDKLLDIDPYNTDVWLLLGKFHTLMNNYEKAIDSFEFYSTIKEDDTTSLRLKAHCLILIGRVDEATEILLECIDNAPSEEILYLSLIDCYIDLEQFENVLNTVALFEAANEILNPLFEAKKAFAYLKLKDNTSSLKYINQALELAPKSEDVNVIAVDIYYSLNEYSKALKSCDIALTKKSDDLYILDKAVIMSLSLDRIEQAILYQKKILEITQTKESKQKLMLLYLENSNKEQFEEYIDSAEEEVLRSLFFLFYKEESTDNISLTREILLAYLHEIYDSGFYFKNTKR